MQKSTYSSATVKKVADNILAKDLLREGDRVLCALSGGADSVALLVILKELSEKLGFTLSAAHLNHGIRGNEADRDEEYCRELCKRLEVPFVSHKVNVPDECKKSGEGLEECARRLRYAFLRSTMRDLDCNKICTAHHADDNIETVLMHMIRGCSVRGLTGIAPSLHDLIRPLLNVRKQELIAFLDEKGIPYVFDSTNNCLDSTRNFIRHKILPEIYEINPSADKAFNRMCSSLSDIVKHLTTQTFLLPSNMSRDRIAELDDAILPLYIMRRFSEVFANTNVPQIDNDTVKLIASAIRTEKGTFKYDIPGNVTAYISDSGLDFRTGKTQAPEDFEMPLFFGENIISPIGYKILIADDKKVAQEWQNIYKSSILTSVNFGKITNEGNLKISVRNRKSKDVYTFGNMQRDVRRQLINFKIPVQTRDTLPVVILGEEIVIVHGLPLNDGFRPHKNEKAAYIVIAPIHES